MTIREYSESHPTYIVVDEVLYAGEVLEKYGLILDMNFTVNNAIDKAAKLLTDLFEEDEDWRELRRIVRSMDIHQDWT